MGTPFLAELRIMSFNFAPRGWALCNGQLLPINQNQALFSLLGTTYGGDGRVNFALPNMQTRVPIHFGNGITQGQAAGTNSHTLSVSEMPTHIHLAAASADSTDNNSTSAPANFFATTVDNSTLYSTNPANQAMNPAVIGNAGGSQPHENRQPFLALNFCIALQGIFPSPN
jgi:microcystin-dependent protein